MEESYGEGLAIHTGPKSCGSYRCVQSAGHRPMGDHPTSKDIANIVAVKEL